MDPGLAALVLLSALLHPLRDLLLKGNPYRESGYLGVTLTWVVCAAGLTLASGADAAAPAAVLPQVLLSAGGLFFYYYGIVLALRHGDLSVYYPIIRGAPVFVVAGGWAVLGQHYSATLLLGIALVVTGAFFLQYRGARFLHEPRLLASALLAMAGSGVYTLADSVAMRSVTPGAFLLWVYVLLSCAYVALFLVLRPAGRGGLEQLLGAWRHAPLRLLAAGVLSFVSYLLILGVFRLGGNVAAVSSLRQASIPISVLLGALVLREGAPGRRFAWSLAVAGGIVVIILARS